MGEPQPVVPQGLCLRAHQTPIKRGLRRGNGWDRLFPVSNSRLRPMPALILLASGDKKGSRIGCEPVCRTQC